jgi:uncharacterized protein (TIGR03086 family)
LALVAAEFREPHDRRSDNCPPKLARRRRVSNAGSVCLVMIDLAPATKRVAELLSRVDDRQLGDPTPCPNNSVGDLIDHIGKLSLGFTASAEKRRDRASGPAPRPDSANLEGGWRTRIAQDLDTLASAWRPPSAWEGFTSAGGIDMPAGVTGVVALDELLVHGWDLAIATGQPYEPSEPEIAAATGFVESFDAPRDGSLFGPVVPVAADAPPLDRLLGLTGRNPQWKA